MTVARIQGPLKTWYDLHEALTHEIDALATSAASLGSSGLASFTERFSFFETELRNHSEVEDAIMFPAIRARGGKVDESFTQEHHREQNLIYEARCALLEAKASPQIPSFGAILDALGQLQAAIVPHLAAEDRDVLAQVDELFDEPEQAELLRTVIRAIPPDPRLQPWLANALTPEHREARLRNMAASLPHESLVALLRQIHDGVPASVWSDIRARTPELASLIDA